MNQQNTPSLAHFLQAAAVRLPVAGKSVMQETTMRMV